MGPRRMGEERVVLVHGFTQTARSWDAVAGILAGRFEVVAVDLPGHGLSADERRTFEEAAAVIGATGGPATYVGYSMGARLCLRLALDRPEVVDRLVLLGGSPGLASTEERGGRKAADDRLAGRLGQIGTGAFLDEWLSQPMFDSLTPAADDLASRRANPPAGLAYALRELGTGAQEPLWDRLGELAMPVLVVAGGLDAKFATLGRRMADAIGDNATFESVPGCGHAAHLEDPERFCGTVERFVHAASRANSARSGTGRRTASAPPTGSSGSTTTSAASSDAVPRPQA
ncbi:MAG: 2-succinyl-6-hydroxy-2,4-cyclohexadiene-carboxylate synthase [Actinomycetota bacterium]|nr:2-succinyl-6-hydroxy-2,4-cyclohexadiene-carboxylate synthase [Actinomycetota bacterium]